MSGLRYANIGLNGLRATGAVGPTTATRGYAETGASHSTGFTAPSTIWDKQNSINASADALNADILKNVGRQAFKDAWKAWYDSWKTFYGKYQQIMVKLGVLFYSDTLDKQTEEWRSQLLGWYDGYAREKDQSGQPLPFPSGQPPSRAPDAPPGEDKEEGFHIPWWVWVAGTLAAVGGGYVLYQNYVRAKRMATAALPLAMGASMGPVGYAMGSAYANDGRDPAYAYAPPHAPPHARIPGAGAYPYGYR